MSWVDEANRKPELSIIECYEKARDELLKALEIPKGSQNAGHFDRLVGGLLMGFVAARHAVANGQNIPHSDPPKVVWSTGRNIAGNAYDDLGGFLADQLNFLLGTLPSKRPVAEMQGRIKETVVFLDEEIRFWAAGSKGIQDKKQDNSFVAVDESLDHAREELVNLMQKEYPVEGVTAQQRLNTFHGEGFAMRVLLHGFTAARYSAANGGRQVPYERPYRTTLAKAIQNHFELPPEEPLQLIVQKVVLPLENHLARGFTIKGLGL